ncbi:MAG: helix-turn-helix domain-containing protein [Acidobacteriota bacterium]
MADSDRRLFTLTEVSQETGISMPTLQRYKKLYQDRLPTVGEGRTQRYPEEALEVFEELKKENMSRRGRPRKNAPPRRTVTTAEVVEDDASVAHEVSDADHAVSVSGELLTLKDVEERTGISYPTLLRYVKTSLKRIPHQGTGRKRRYPPEAVDVFKTLREESRRGRRAGRPGNGDAPRAVTRRPRTTGSGDSAALVAQLRDVQKAIKDLQRTVKQLEREIHKPLKVVVQRQG